MAYPHSAVTGANLHHNRGDNRSGIAWVLDVNTIGALRIQNSTTNNVLSVDTSTTAGLTNITIGNATDQTILTVNGRQAVFNADIVFPERVGDPTAIANSLIVYSKDVAGVTHLFARASGGTVYQLTPTGGGGNVTGPGPSVVADAITTWNGTGGLTIKESPFYATTGIVNTLTIGAASSTASTLVAILAGASATAGGTNNIQGSPLQIRAGISVGNATPGYVEFYTSQVAASGNSLQTVQRRATILGQAAQVTLQLGNTDATVGTSAAPLAVVIAGDTSSVAATAGAAFTISAGNNSAGSGAGAGGAINLNAGSTLAASTGVGGSIFANCGTSGAGAGGSFRVFTANTGTATEKFSVNPAGDCKVFVTSLFADQRASPPIAPAQDELRMYGFSYAERTVPTVQGELGAAWRVQPSLGRHWMYWTPSATTAAMTSLGGPWTVTVTQAHPTPASGSILSGMNRATFTTAAVAGDVSGTRCTQNKFYRGDAAGRGGFEFFGRFAIETYTSDMSIVFGLYPNAVLAGANPSTLNNSAAIGKDAADTSWVYWTRDGATTNKVTSGTAIAAGDVIDVWIYCAPNGSEVVFRMVRVNDGTVIVNNAVLSANLPTNTVFVSPNFFVRAGAGAAVVVGALMKIEVSSDT